jgi:hypothetical protein
MSPASARIDNRHFGPPPARIDVTVLSPFVQHALLEVVLLPAKASKDVCPVGFGPSCPGEASGSFKAGSLVKSSPNIVGGCIDFVGCFGIPNTANT